MTEAQYQEHLSPSKELDDDVYVFPASYAQQRLWFLDQFEPNSPFYNIANAVRFEGDLDLDALERGLNEIIRRHETLRTTFASVGGKPVQVISPRGSLKLRLRDLSNLPEKDRQAEALRLAREEAQTPFDLQRGPLLRASVLRMAEADHILLLTMHHIISDGWSMGILVRELTTLYAAYTGLARGEKDQPISELADSSILPELPIQYADYAQWQQEWLQGSVLEEHIHYWRERLGRDVPVLELYTDRPRPAVQTYRGATHSIKITQIVVNKLKELSVKEGATLFMTMLAAFQTLLYRYTAQEDICVGTPTANRNRQEIEGLIGFFVNTLVVRTDLSGNPTFRQLLQRVREITLGAFAHQDLPFEMLVERLQPERDMSRSTFFQVMFIMQNAPAGAVELPGLRLSMLETEIGTATFDITLSLSELQDGMDASIEYNTDLFDASTIARLLQNFATLLESIAEDPNQPISALSLLTPQEKRQLLFEWASTQREYPLANHSIHSLFESQAERTPQAIAVVYPESENEPAQRLTYQELNQRANQLAHYLIEQGIGPNQLVAVCAQKSLEMVVGILGILKAGAAYLPLDPSLPQERLNFMLHDSGARLLLTQSSAMHAHPAPASPVASFESIARFYLDTEWHKLASLPQTNPGVVTQPNDLAYTIYTSGSTGAPKGVQICQHSLVNAYLAWEEIYHLREPGAQGSQPAVHLQMANFAFDVFTGDLVRALCSGGTLVLCPRETLLDPAQLYLLILREGITHAEFVPAVLRSLMQYLEETHQNLAQMRLLACGSDIWHVREYRRIKHLCGSQTRVINSYGLTEATIDSSFFEGSQSNLPPDRIVPIGRPFPNTQMYILDQRLQPQPIGVPGELFVGGAGLALGYLNQPELTAEKFIPHPFEPGKRLYRTGDLARYLPDGNIEYLGRKDFQIKIRGYRIETGEIEAALKSHPGVQDAVVAALPPQAPGAAQEASPTPRLVAYLVARHMVDRAPHRCTCQAITLDDLGQACDGQPAQVEIVDLSASGAQLLNIPSIWRRGQPIQIDLELPKSTSSGNGSNAPQINTGNHRLSLKGRISWQAGGKAGLEFDLEHSQQAALDQAIRQAEKSLIGKQPLSDLRAADLRLPVHHLCWIEPAFTPQEHSQRRTAALENLSLGGARLNMQSDTALTFTQSDQAFSDLDWQVGKAVRIGLSSPDWPGELKLQGLVRWCQSHLIGIAFDSNPQEQMRLEQFLQTVINARRFSVGQLRSYLKARLADYMLPSAFVLMDALPLTPNGKIDRKALPAPDWSQADWGEEYIAPRTPTETKLAEIWGQVLGRQSSSHIGVRDNFFNLGGHSLLATQLVSRIHQVFEIDLPLRNVFEYPTLEELAERVEILLRGGYSLQAGAITPIPRQGELPLSFAQQRMWFLDQLEPGSPFYNIPEAVRLTGNLDVSALHRSLQIVVQRHEILRTNFHTRDGKPVPEIHPELKIPLQEDDLSHLPPAEREARAQQIAQQEAQTAFDLSCGPLLRARLVRLEKDDHIVLLTMHHIIGDDWSTRVMISEISAIYSAIIQGQDPSLPDLPIQYVDYAAWQRGWLQGKVLEEQLAYWKRQLAGCPPLLELPTDRPRPAVQSFKGSYLTFSLSPQLTKSLRLLCQQEGVTQFMLLLAAFQALLHRYSGQDDICVGTPIANRNRADIEPLIGFFVNTLVLHTTFCDRMTFRELMQQVRECCLGAYAHQDVPFELVVDALQPERNLSQSPLFQVMFVIQNAPGEAQQIPGLTIQPIEAHSGTAKFDLTLFMLEEYERLGGAVEYCTDLFDAATIERMLEHFQNLLESAVTDPDQFVEHLPLLGAAELHQLLHAWNDTIAPPLAGDNLPCMQQMIEEQVQRTPDAIAVTQVLEINGAVRSLTYRELNARANQLAHALRQIGAGPDTLVCVCMDRSLELLVGLLGILKAGSAYVPLDPTYPVDRLAYMLEDVAQWGEREIPAVQTGIHALSKPVILITQRASLPLFESLPIGRSGLIHIICLDEIWEKRANESSSTSRTESARSLNNPGGKFELEIGRQPVTNPACLTTPDHLAYVIYTSGSTGRPKGVMITHGGLSNYLHWCLRAYPLEQGSGSPVHSSISFDLTVTSLFSPLLVGRQAVLLPESLGPQALGELLLQVNQSHADEPSGSWHPQTFSLIKITPAHLKLLGEMIPAQQASRLTHAFVIGGENLLPEHVDFWQTYAPGTRLFNEYGPTETVVGCCVYELPPKTSEATPSRPTANGALPIGRPIINTCLYVLDKHQQPTPLGVHGELYIGGAGVARGYINRPDLTSERFIPNPFTPAEAGANRLYRTGDLAYYLPDGNLVCLGRVDFQVKIRGFRVELGEIESLLNQHELVHESVAWVLVQNGHKRLVAYVVPQDSRLLSHGAAQKACTETLHDYLKRNLPDYMVPAAFVYLSKLPLTSNGKVDRAALAALPVPDFELSEVEEGFVAPRNHCERLLADIWASVLGLHTTEQGPAIGIHQNFFELGGDSILAIQVVARANQAGLKLSPRHIFEAPTIASLAELAGRDSPILAEQGAVTGELPLTPIQRWFFEQELPNPAHWNQSLLLDLQQPLQRACVEQTLQHLLAHHDALRTRFERTPQGWKARIVDPDEKVSDYIEWRSLSEMDAAHRSIVITATAERLQSSLDLQHGPLFKLAYFDLGAQPASERRAVLLLVAHHLVMDGVSWRIFLEDFMSVYMNLSNQLPAGLPLKTTSYKQWAYALQTHAKSSAIREQIPYWLQLAQSPHCAIPLDFIGGDNCEASAVTLSTTLSEAETIELRHLPSLMQGLHLDQLLLAAVVQALAEWLAPVSTADPPAVLIELEGHGREPIQFETDPHQTLDLTRTIGWFTSLYPVRFDTHSSEQFGQNPGKAFEAVQRAMQAVPQKGLGYGLLRYLSLDDLPPDQSPRREICAIRPPISFNYLGQIDAHSLVAQTALPDAQAMQAGIALSREARGPERAPANPRTHLLEIECVIAGESLQIEWTYSSQLHRPETISRLAQSCLQNLRQLIAWCGDAHSRQATSQPIAQEKRRSPVEHRPPRISQEYEIFGWSEAEMEDIFDEIEKMFEADDEDEG